MQRPARALAVHVCADVLNAEPHGRWPRPISARDTARRLSRACRRAGIAEQHTLRGELATSAALTAAVRHASTALANDGLFVLTFSGHTERGNGPVATARWCLYNGGVTVSQIATSLALLPPAARLVIVADTCYAGAIAGALAGTQDALVVAGCREDQPMVWRESSEFVVRFESFVCSLGASGSVKDLRVLLESDTPDCERPFVWTNSEPWWARRPFDLGEAWPRGSISIPGSVH